MVQLDQWAVHYAWHRQIDGQAALDPLREKKNQLAKLNADLALLGEQREPEGNNEAEMTYAIAHAQGRVDHKRQELETQRQAAAQPPPAQLAPPPKRGVGEALKNDVNTIDDIAGEFLKAFGLKR